ncbi:hypothetical protein J4H86_21115 [Spiractinospora alimapuensis]|uniref:hypothetical protein n=1 Tax=Spiractinospora alimapuensis TaxID=2820884 RepID=UPI001F47F0FD|nr:hypothetical protein [Spiractinospora alimapuensis]QVQ51295.1 hypothetical protein J4H86_21115 [Spiractinospora alimapuensis]
MAVVWSNSFDGVDGTVVTAENSGGHGDPVAAVAGVVRYSAAWTAAGAASARIEDVADASGLAVEVGAALGRATWAARLYFYVPAGGSLVCATNSGGTGGSQLATIEIRDAEGMHRLLGQEVGTDLVGRTVRVEWIRPGRTATTSLRAWWTDPHAVDDPDVDITGPTHTISATLLQLLRPGGWSGPAYVDEVAISDAAEWIGPVVVQRHSSARATLTLSGHADATRIADGRSPAQATLALTPRPVGSTRATRVGAGAHLGLVGSASSRRATTVAAGASLGLVARPVGSRRIGDTPAVGMLSLTARPAEATTRTRPSFPPRVTTELFLGDRWVDVSGDVRVSEDIHITRGRADEAASADPSSCALTLDNRDGKYSPRNPLSPYYGLIGKNTPLRVRVADPAPAPEPLLVDTFSRTITSGWGTADTGQSWETDPAGIPVRVVDGTGRIRLDSAGADQWRLVHTADDVAGDVDVTVSMMVPVAPRGVAGGAIYGSIVMRRRRRGADWVEYRGNVGTRVASAGRVRISAHISHGGGDGAITGGLDAPVADLPYTPGDWLRVRAQAIGPEIRMRVWPDGAPEPEVWHAQAWHADLVGGGLLGIRAIATDNVDPTTLPVEVHFRDLEVRPAPAPDPGYVRFTGEVSSWPSRWDLSDSDVQAPVTASGILRRLGQGQKPITSPLRRTVPRFFPIAYWPMEEGSDAQQARSLVPGVPPVRARSLDFAADSSLAGSGPLPQVREGGRIIGPSLAMESTTWEVSAAIHLDEWPELETEQTLISIVTADWRIRVTLRDVSGPTLWIYQLSLDGDVIDFEGTRVVDSPPRLVGGWRRIGVRSTDGQIHFVYWTAEGEWGSGLVYNLVGPPLPLRRLEWTFGPELSGMGVGHLSVWDNTGHSAMLSSLPGFAGESARARLDRIAADRGVPLEITGRADEAMGPEPEASTLAIIEEAQEADLGVPGEARHHLGLTYRGRDTLYSAEPVLVLDYEAGVISEPFEPEDDDQSLRNEIEVQRSSGSSAEAADHDGPLGIAAVGRYDESVSLNLHGDAQAQAQAEWRLHLGTVDALRWPSIRLNLANPRVRNHIEDILRLDAGDRIRILHPPSWTQADALDLIVQGYEELLNLHTWEITLTCTPASPWLIGQWHHPDQPPDDQRDRYDTPGSTLVGDLDETAIELPVTAAVPGHGWTTDPADMPFDIAVGGEVMRVTAASTGWPQVLTVERAVNGVSKSHRGGTDVRLHRPAIVGL